MQILERFLIPDDQYGGAPLPVFWALGQLPPGLGDPLAAWNSDTVDSCSSNLVLGPTHIEVVIFILIVKQHHIDSNVISFMQ